MGRELEKMRREVDRLRMENRALEAELDSRGRRIEELDKKAEKQLAAYEAIVTECEGAIEQAAEARLFYEKAMADAKKIERDYIELTKQLGVDLKQIKFREV